MRNRYLYVIGSQDIVYPIGEITIHLYIYHFGFLIPIIFRLNQDFLYFVLCYNFSSFISPPRVAITAKFCRMRI